MIVVTGATGQLGRLVVEGLLKKVPAAEIAVAVRTPEKAADLAARGVQVRTADFNRPEGLAAAFTGADKLLLISGSEVGKRVAQHTAAIAAAKEAGVGHLVYTSILHADTSTLGLAPEHLATERAILDSGLPFTLLRNGWYTENYASAIAQAAEHGSFAGSAGGGEVASASRADYADAAVEVLTGHGHEGQVYELSGDVAWNYETLAAELTRLTGKEVAYRNLSAEQHHEFLVGAGLPAEFAAALVSYDQGIAYGQLDATPGTLRALLGHPATPLAETAAAVLGH
ncbi:SDR family oxidoreductase [Amycolatopsis sp. H20-H5]|uniref:SDR family oxidoreductase n=1 Tax=Amycolatopsis sp. H20-H5 TaxID=3046309 RepID=UPI002DB8C752|nr:SDR family oxidoreductase [Amycolatopsis sp. H20-H5]MEC3980913.1 SDR family oxidoreductase [Amycolatopsis sp. H20-H5]